MSDIVIEQEDPRRADVLALLRELDTFNEGLYPPEANHHLDVDELCSPDIVFLVARRAGEAVGIGALWLRRNWKLGEVKRMYVGPAARGMGLAGKMLARIEQEARDNQIARLMLETGNLSTAALSVYQRAGFSVRGPFADYPDHPQSVFMEKPLT